MTFLDFIEKGSQLSKELSEDPKLRIFIDGTEINLESFKFKLVKDDNKNYELVLSN